MKTPVRWSWIASLFLGLLIGCGNQPDSETQETVSATTGILEITLPVRGTLRAANPTTIRSEIEGIATIEWVIADGTPVEKGDLIARFDPSEWTGKFRAAERDLRVATAERNALLKATHPLELQQLETEHARLKQEALKQTGLLEKTRSLVDQQLIAPEELNQQERIISDLKNRITALEQKQTLTQTVLHPAQKEQADARFDDARQTMEHAKAFLEATRVKAPIQGIVHLPQVPVDSDRRPVRVGDGIYNNQPYLEVADLTDLIITCEIRERDLSRVLPGLTATVQIPALPGLQYQAVVTHVGTRPVGNRQQYPVKLRFEAPPAQARPGLTAELELLLSRSEESTLLPLEAVQGSLADPFVVLAAGDRQPVTLGEANERLVIIREGLTAGDRVLLP